MMNQQQSSAHRWLPPPSTTNIPAAWNIKEMEALQQARQGNYISLPLTLHIKHSIPDLKEYILFSVINNIYSRRHLTLQSWNTSTSSISLDANTTSLGEAILWAGYKPGRPPSVIRGGPPSNRRFREHCRLPVIVFDVTLARYPQ